MTESYSADKKNASASADAADTVGTAASADLINDEMANQNEERISSFSSRPVLDIEISELSFFYPSYGRKKLDIFSFASLPVKRGQIHVVLGLPGSGKSTLAKILIRAVPRYTGGSFSGNVLICGKDVTSCKLYDMMEIVGYAAQDPDEEIIMTAVEDEIAFPLESLGLGREEIGRRVDAALADFGLEAMRDAAPAELSGGEKKRLLLAVSEALQTKIVVLDETLEELDEQFRKWFLNHCRKQGLTVLITASKIDDLLASEADAVSWLQDGKFRTGSRQHILDLYKKHQQIEPVLYRTGKNGRREVQAGVCTAELRNLLFSYGKRFSLFIPQLTLNSGKITALVGPNGSGKSTLSKLLCGLLEPHEGEIRLFRQANQQADADGDPADAPVKERKNDRMKDRKNDRTSARSQLQRSVGYLFQNPDYQIFASTVDDELGYGLKRAGITGAAYADALERAKKLFSLEHEGATPPSLLSYGERKRLQAAVYYLLPRKFYIFDEIDSGLSFREICSLLQIFADTGAGIVLVTHHLDFARTIADTVITLENGKIAAMQEGAT